MNQRIGYSSRIESLVLGLLLAFLLTITALIYWAIVRAPPLSQRPDNPRVVDAELQIRRGRILDANGIVLAETVGNDGAPIRIYPVPSIGPAVGYYSFRHGTAGIEQGYDEVLRGRSEISWDSLWREALHRPRAGQDIRLTLDADWQREAEALMAGEKGALLILSVPDGAVQVMISHPGYDPNRLDEQFEALAEDDDAPLLNRVTQGFYQPGLALQPFILAAALEQGLLQLDDPAPGVGASILVRDILLRCRETPPDDPTWAEVLRIACPAPMTALAGDFSPEQLTGALQQFGFYEQPAFPIQTAPVASQPIEDSDNAILGQEFLTVTPLQMARAWLALANGGRLAAPDLVQEFQNAAGAWQPAPADEGERQAVNGAAASAILNALVAADGSTVEHFTTALSGPQRATTAWYLGLSPTQSPRYAVVVALEEAADAEIAREIGRAALQLAPAADR